MICARRSIPSLALPASCCAAWKGKLPDLQKENLQKVLISGEHLLGLINTLLDLAKIDVRPHGSGRRIIPRRRCHHMAATTVEPLLKDGRVRLVRDIAPGLPPIKTDRDKLKQILLNLLSNAAKFTEQGEIRISAAQENGNLKLAVADTGIGMTAGSAGAYIRRISASGKDHGKQIRRHRPGPGHRQTSRQAPRRRHRSHQRRRQRLAVHRDDPDGAETVTVRRKGTSDSTCGTV